MGDTSLCKVRKNHQFERDIKYSFKPLLSTMKKNNNDFGRSSKPDKRVFKNFIISPKVIKWTIKFSRIVSNDIKKIQKEFF